MTSLLVSFRINLATRQLESALIKKPNALKLRANCFLLKVARKTQTAEWVTIPVEYICHI